MNPTTTLAESTAAQKAWRELAPSALIAHILETHHGYTRSELARLETLVSSVRELHQERHPELILVDRLVARLRDDLLPHMQKEEMILFPSSKRSRTGPSPRSVRPRSRCRSA